jgi:cation-transporting ATPase E
LSTPPITGLTAAEVRERSARGQTNAYQSRVGRTYAQIVRENVFNVFNVILLTLLGIVLVLGDYGTVLFAGFSVVSNTLLSLIQEVLAKRKLDQLAALNATEIAVIRAGVPQRIRPDALVIDDVIPVTPGDRLVVDGIFLSSNALEMDESHLTGESDPVLKDVSDHAVSGSYCLAGSGMMRVTRVGRDSTINRLTDTARAFKRVLTPTQVRLARIVEVTIVLIAVCAPMYFVAGLLTRGQPFTLETFRAAVIFIASIVPQGLVLTATIALSVGAVRLSMQRTLVQRVNAVEGMANVTVLCFDKTGTLTRNQLSVDQVIALSDTPPEADLRVYITQLSTRNTTAAAIQTYLENNAPSDRVHAKGAPESGQHAIRELPFTSARQYGMITFADHALILGAPERVLPPQHPAHDQADEYARQGVRVLAFARAALDANGDAVLPAQPLAFVLLRDHLRDDARATLTAFADQQVALKVISGDHIETVTRIARDAGMAIHAAYTGDQLHAMTDVQFDHAAWHGDLFARIDPDTKRRLIAAIKRHGAFVAMVGDGVNDVPALKAAHLALVMNDGAAISKDVGDIVLLDNAMSSLPRALNEGRAITQSIYATSKLFLVKNVYSILFFILIGFMAIPFPIGAIQISILTTIMINAPAGLYAFRLLKPPPMRRYRHDVLDFVVTAGIIGGIAMTLNALVIYLASGLDTAVMRSASYFFLTLWAAVALWDAQGIDLLRSASIRAHPRAFVISLILTVLALVAPIIVPNILVYSPPAPLHLLLTSAVFALAYLVTRLLMRTRAAANTLWGLADV